MYLFAGTLWEFTFRKWGLELIWQAFRLSKPVSSRSCLGCPSDSFIFWDFSRVWVTRLLRNTLRLHLALRCSKDYKNRKHTRHCACLALPPATTCSIAPLVYQIGILKWTCPKLNCWFPLLDTHTGLPHTHIQIYPFPRLPHANYSDLWYWDYLCFLYFVILHLQTLSKGYYLHFQNKSKIWLVLDVLLPALKAIIIFDWLIGFLLFKVKYSWHTILY